MNLKQGFERITWILSVMVVPGVFFVILIMKGGGGWLEFFVASVICWVCGFLLTWAIYKVVYWIIKGFRDSDKK